MPDAADQPVDAPARLDPLAARRADALVHALEIAVAHLDTDLTGAVRTTLVLEGEVDSTLDQLAGPRGDGTASEPGLGVTPAGPAHGIASSASEVALRRRDPFALQPVGWDGARLDLDFALEMEVMYQELGRLPAAT